MYCKRLIFRQIDKETLTCTSSRTAKQPENAPELRGWNFEPEIAPKLRAGLQAGLRGGTSTRNFDADKKTMLMQDVACNNMQRGLRHGCDATAGRHNNDGVARGIEGLKGIIKSIKELKRR